MSIIKQKVLRQGDKPPKDLGADHKRYGIDVGKNQRLDKRQNVMRDAYDRLRETVDADEALQIIDGLLWEAALPEGAAGDFKPFAMGMVYWNKLMGKWYGYRALLDDPEIKADAVKLAQMTRHLNRFGFRNFVPRGKMLLAFSMKDKHVSPQYATVFITNSPMQGRFGTEDAKAFEELANK